MASKTVIRSIENGVQRIEVMPSLALLSKVMFQVLDNYSKSRNFITTKSDIFKLKHFCHWPIESDMFVPGLIERIGRTWNRLLFLPFGLIPPQSASLTVSFPESSLPLSAPPLGKGNEDSGNEIASLKNLLGDVIGRVRLYCILQQIEWFTWLVFFIFFICTLILRFITPIFTNTHEVNDRTTKRKLKASAYNLGPDSNAALSSCWTRLIN